MSNEVIETVSGEETNLQLHVDLCSQRYSQLIRKFDEVDEGLKSIKETLIDIQNRLHQEQNSKLTTYLAWAGVVITTLLGAVIGMLTL